MTTTVHNAKLGFFLSLFTAFMWGNMPIAVQQIMVSLDAPTLVWYRFVISLSILWPILALKKDLPFTIIKANPKLMIVLSIMTLGIVGNFLLFSASLIYTTPTVVQIVTQLSSVGLLFASVIIFKEHLSRIQILGVIILVIGLLLFFNRNLIELFSSFNSYSIGVGLVVLASISWVFFAIAQKFALRTFNSLQVLFILNLFGIICLSPFVDFSSIFKLNTLQVFLLLYCGLNTILGYGSLAESMRVWEVSKVSAMITLAPLFTLGFSIMLSYLWPSIFSNPNLNLLGYLGAFVVVFGAMFMVIGKSILRSLSQRALKK